MHMAVIQDPAAPLAGRIQAARALVACDDRSVVEWLSAWERATVHPSLQKALAKTVRRIRGRWRNSDERDYSWK